MNGPIRYVLSGSTEGSEISRKQKTNSVEPPLMRCMRKCTCMIVNGNKMVEDSLMAMH